MKYELLKSSQHFMSILLQFITKKTMMVGAAATLFIAVIFCGIWLTNVYATSKPQSPDERIITIHDKENEKVVISKATTVEDVLKQAKIPLQSEDSVDPQLDTKLTANAYQINIYRARPVLVIDGGLRKVVMTPFDTPRQIAETAGLTLYDEDVTSMSRSEDLIQSGGSGVELSIKRATVFNFVVYGSATESRTQARTVGEMLKDKKIKLGKDDALSLPLTTPITAGMKVELWRNGKQTINEEQPISFEIQNIQDANQPIGYREIRTAGVPGKKLVTYEVEMKNGQEIARREIQSVQIAAPQTQVEVVGTKGTFSGSFSDALAKLRSCEGKYTSINPIGYYGAYQFDIQTWGGYGGYPNAAAAPPEVQDQKAWETYQRRGWQPWPSCSRKLGLQDIYR